MKTTFRRALILLFALSCSNLGAQNPPPKGQKGFRVAVNMVLVNVSVTRPDGKRLPDLRPEDFELNEDGVKQELKFFRSAEAPFHVALLIDSSGSTAAKLDLIRKAADRFLRRLAPEDRVSIIDVAGRVEVIQGSTDDRRVLGCQLRRIGTTKENGTLLRDAILQTLVQVFRGIEGRKAVVFLTDAQDAGSKSSMEQLKQAAYVSDAVLYSLLVDTKEDIFKTMRTLDSRVSRIGLVLEASSESAVDDVKEAARLLIDLLPASIPICLVDHRSARRAALLVSYTTDRAKLKEVIAKASVHPRAIELASSWKASGTTVLLTNSDWELRQRVQDDILDYSALFVLGKRPAEEWREQLKGFAKGFPDPSDLKQAIKELPVKYSDARKAITDLCDHSGGRSFRSGGNGRARQLLPVDSPGVAANLLARLLLARCTRQIPPSGGEADDRSASERSIPSGVCTAVDGLPPHSTAYPLAPVLPAACSACQRCLR